MRWDLPLATCSSSRRISTWIFSWLVSRRPVDRIHDRSIYHRLDDAAVRRVSDCHDRSGDPDGQHGAGIRGCRSGGRLVVAGRLQPVLHQHERRYPKRVPNDTLRRAPLPGDRRIDWRIGRDRVEPSLSIASKAGTVAFSTYRDNGYEIHTLRDAGQIAGTPVDGAAPLPPVAAIEEPETIEPVPQLPLPHTASVETGYRPRLSLEAVGSPYFWPAAGRLAATCKAACHFFLATCLAIASS